ncbi:hypothetical protein [Streptomyces luteireticuli]|uniref:hypothetical protein n=1 Tax=Streptomyces luteireticuli TaxID=173858 RepID=UPI003556F22D
MSTTASPPGDTGSTRRNFSIEDTVWTGAQDKAKNQGLVITRALEYLLAGYVAGTITITPPAFAYGRDRVRRSADITDSTWNASDDRRKTDGLRSMAALVELLLRGYAEGTITLTFIAAGHARDTATAGRQSVA